MLALALSGGVSQHAFWYLGRSSGFVAYWLLFASVVIGIAVSSRVFDGWLGRAWVFETHKFLSVFVLVVMAFHALVMLPDRYASFSIEELLIPFQSHLKSVPIALGIVSLYGSVLVSASFYMKGLIGQNGWRLLHYLTFVLFVMTLAHGLLTGTDSKEPIVLWSYFSSGLIVLFFLFYRVLALRSPQARARVANMPGSVELR